MKNGTNNTLLWALVMTLMLLSFPDGWADNRKTTVEQVTTEVTLTDDVDYIVSSNKPFAAGGMVNIASNGHAVLILSAVKPSQALRLLSTYVQVDGVRAVDGTNCQVKLYNLGCIILPYGDSVKPLTVYSGQNYEGESCNDFGLEHSGGYMNTLKEAKLNNRIRSFKLKRGYMVTFANGREGRGYSRCFIAADGDLEVPSLPGILDRSISSYRVFKWYDAGKKQLANDLNTSTLAALNVQSSYTWSEGHNMAPDYECVPNHIYEDYPSSAAIGSATWSPHSKNNNEPRNSADDHPQDLQTILNNWENMMRTGMRLCTPASWDGSDYWNATGFLAEFLDSIDARGWRCDIIDLHCYWAEGSFGNIANWVNKYKRPVWISEWCWGASWNRNGSFAEGVTETQVRDALERICTNLNKWNYVERYYYWNGERDPSRLYKDGKLTPAGEMYAKLDGGVGYNGKYDFVPRVVAQRDPGALSVDYDKTTHSATLSWHEYNGEMNAGIYVQRRANVTASWQTIADVPMKEGEADYTYTDTEAVNGCQYRVQIVDANNKERNTKAVMAASATLEAGDAVDVDGTTRYLGGNLLLNGAFDMGLYGWTNGQGEPLSQPHFQVVPVGGIDNGAYLQAYGSGSVDSESAIKMAVAVLPGADYYFSGSNCNSGVLSKVQFTTDGKKADTSVTDNVGMLNNSTSTWTTQFSVFNSGDYGQVLLSFRSLGAKAQFANLGMFRLFDNEAEAIADGIAVARQRAQAVMGYNNHSAALNTALQQQIEAVTGSDRQALRTLTQATDRTLEACHLYEKRQARVERASQLLAWGMYGSEALADAVSKAQPTDSETATDVIGSYEQLGQAIDGYMPMTVVDDAVVQPYFADATGWTTKCGTYTRGDQRTNTMEGITFWNAWWSGLSASEGTAKTMAVKQEIKSLEPGLYAVECQATTEHFCLSDQHAFIANATDTAVSAVLQHDYFDLPTVAATDRWQTLVSLPVYVDDGGSVTIGFQGSKQGATDYAWHAIGSKDSKGDLREGWWGATGFKLKYYPMYKRTVESGVWGTCCLPYSVTPSEGLHLYRIVGITADYQNICVEEITAVEPGMPFVYRSDHSEAVFLEHGVREKLPGEGNGNMKGYFDVRRRASKGHYVLTDGQWTRVTTSRPYLNNYTAVLTSIAGLDVKTDWTGATIPIVGATDEKTEGIDTIPLSDARYDGAADGWYTLDGRRVNSTSGLKPGVYVKVERGKAMKLMVKRLKG